MREDSSFVISSASSYLLRARAYSFNFFIRARFSLVNLRISKRSVLAISAFSSSRAAAFSLASSILAGQLWRMICLNRRFRRIFCLQILRYYSIFDSLIISRWMSLGSSILNLHFGQIGSFLRDNFFQQLKQLRPLQNSHWHSLMESTSILPLTISKSGIGKSLQTTQMNCSDCSRTKLSEEVRLLTMDGSILNDSLTSA
mmetsp:Transcript_1892/g.2635  ORF Transcript_1892/g.2635 Transcript_1892/m.2635 type:complete len:200 (-) Transcript_1892:412-1011(-)